MCGAYLAGADDAVVAQLEEAAYAVGFAPIAITLTLCVSSAG